MLVLEPRPGAAVVVELLAGRLREARVPHVVAAGDVTTVVGAARAHTGRIVSVGRYEDPRGSEPTEVRGRVFVHHRGTALEPLGKRLAETLQSMPAPGRVWLEWRRAKHGLVLPEASLDATAILDEAPCDGLVVEWYGQVETHEALAAVLAEVLISDEAEQHERVARALESVVFDGEAGLGSATTGWGGDQPGLLVDSPHDAILCALTEALSERGWDVEASREPGQPRNVEAIAEAAGRDGRVVLTVERCEPPADRVRARGRIYVRQLRGPDREIALHLAAGLMRGVRPGAVVVEPLRDGGRELVDASVLRRCLALQVAGGWHVAWYDEEVGDVSLAEAIAEGIDGGARAAEAASVAPPAPVERRPVPELRDTRWRPSARLEPVPRERRGPQPGRRATDYGGSRKARIAVRGLLSAAVTAAGTVASLVSVVSAEALPYVAGLGALVIVGTVSATALLLWAHARADVASIEAGLQERRPDR